MEVPVNSKSSISSESSQSEAEINFAIGSTRGENDSFQLIVETLNVKNFREWAQFIKLVINDKGKLGYLTG